MVTPHGAPPPSRGQGTEHGPTVGLDMLPKPKDSEPLLSPWVSSGWSLGCCPDVPWPAYVLTGSGQKVPFGNVGSAQPPAYQGLQRCDPWWASCEHACSLSAHPRPRGCFAARRPLLIGSPGFPLQDHKD